MCGIVGIVRSDTKPVDEALLSRMSAAIRHRGPDDDGFYVNGGVGLGMRRLSIIDIQGGQQPIHNQDRTAWIVFNGEIYNYLELRAELAAAGHQFVSQSDTEVLLAAWAHWGTSCLMRLVGMFAFVMAERGRGTLTCVRDGFGIKPLFISRPSWGFCFASELPAAVALRGEGAELNLQQAYDYLVHGDYDSSESTFVAGITQLSPGTLQVLDLHTGELAAPVRWWAPAVHETSRLSFDDAAAHLRHLFLDSVRQHLRSDVPLGVALSGGIDSSAVVCAMRKIAPDAPIHTFSFVAKNTAVSEEHWAQLVNGHVGATAHCVTVNPQELARDLDDMILAQGEPFGSTSIYAQYRVYKLARESGVTVTLDGQGADELLAGYQGYPGKRVHSLLDGGSLLRAASFLYRWAQWPERSFSYGVKASLSEYLAGPFYPALRELAGHRIRPDWLDSDLLAERGVRLAFPRQVADKSPRGRRLISELALTATRRGLPALLRHADRNSMRFSVESRVPFLTPGLADFLLSLREDYLISSQGETKRIFRAAMRGIVPDAILDRRDKVGFATPEIDWLSSLAAQAREWINEGESVDFLKPTRMLQEFDQILAGHTRFTWQAWRWINFCRWHSRVLLPLSQTGGGIVRA